MSSEQRFQRAYKALNRQQRLAVEATEGPVMVLAGPGTGKTEVLAVRVANILRTTQMDPWNILCLTFTESGVAAMRARLRGIIGPAAYGVRIHTFHSFCNDVIREYPELFPAAGDRLVLTDIERIQFVQAVVGALPATSPLKPFGRPDLYVLDVARAIQLLKQEDISAERLRSLLTMIARFIDQTRDTFDHFFQLKASVRRHTDCVALQQAVNTARRQLLPGTDFSDPFVDFDQLFAAYEQALGGDTRQQSRARTKLKHDLALWWSRLQRHHDRQVGVARALELYQRRLRRQGRYDYEDMITLVTQALRSRDSLLARYQEQFQYILVDEYQDTNGGQNELLALLASWDEQPNVFVVGDDKQSIFRFQGASMENLLSFYEHYRSSVKVISLVNNYRSHQLLLDAAHAVIAHSPVHLAERVIGVRDRLRARNGGRGRKIAVAGLPSADHESAYVADAVARLVATKVSPAEIAVLFRYHGDGDGVYDRLQQLGIPATIVGSRDVFASALVQRLLVIFQYLADVRRDDLLFQALHFDHFRLNPLDVAKAAHYASERRVSLLTVLSDARRQQAAGVQDGSALAHAVDTLARWRAASVQLPLERAFAHVLEESQVLEGALQSADGFSDVAAVATLLAEIRRLHQAKRSVSVGDWLAHLQLHQDFKLRLLPAGLRPDPQAVSLLTAHTAKGLEFAHVFVIGLADGRWGNARGRERLPLPAGLLRQPMLTVAESTADERRLFYVAMTRAKQQLTLSWAQRDERGRAQAPALFVAEIPERYVKRVIPRLPVRRILGMPDTQQRRQRPAQPIARYVRHLLESYVLSVTHLNNFLQCPRLFYYRNLLQIPSAKTKHQIFGTAVHAALRDCFTAARPNRGLLLERFGYHLERGALSDDERTAALAVGRDALRRYAAHWRKEFRATVLVEYDFRPQGIHFGSIPLTGKVDKVEVIDAGRRLARVVDYKTGNPDRAGAVLRADGTYARQLVFYRLLADLAPRFPYTVRSGVIDFIQPSRRSGALVRREVPLTDDAVAALQATIKAAWQGIQSLVFLEAESELFCGQCEYCQSPYLTARSGLPLRR